jgi:DNA-binding transcriptional LysR family regulator
MHSRLLEYFEAIVRHGSIRKAGEATNVAPSAINRHLLELEQLVGVSLFQRMPRGMRLTAAGEILSLHVRTTLRDYDRALSEIEQLKTGTRGHVTVACIDSALSDLLPDIIHSFANRFPRIELKVLGSPAAQAVQLVLGGTVDVCLIFNPPPRLPLTEIAVAKFPIGIVVAPHHALAGLKSAQLSDVLGHQLVMPDESTTIHDHVHQLQAETGLRLQPRMVSNSLTFLQNYVERGDAITIMTPVGIGQKLRDKRLIFIPLRDRGFPAQRLIGSVPDKSLPIAVANFCDHLRFELPNAFLSADSAEGI